MDGVRREMAKHDVRIRRRNERSQRSGNRRAIQSNFGSTSLHFPIQSGDELQRGKEINGMGEGASRSCSGFVWWSDQVDRKETFWCKSVDAKSSTTSLRPVGLKEKSLDGSKNVRYLYVTGELEGGQRRATDPVWSPVWSSISKNHLWIKVSLYSTIWKMDQSVVSSEKSFRLFHLELSCLLKEFVDLKIKKNEFLNSLKQSWWMNSRKW